MPEAIVPMLSRPSALPASEDDYAFEVKWDGIRAICFVDRGRLRLQSRNLLDLTRQYPEIEALSDQLRKRRLVLDGEVVAFDDTGRPSFQHLQGRMGVAAGARHRVGATPVTYMAFDLLYEDGRDLMPLPYTARRERLGALKLDGPHWHTPDYFIGQGSELLQAARAKNFEGIMAKKLDSLYEPGARNGNWLKIKIQRRQEFVIAGWSPGEGSRHGTIGSLLLGVYDRSSQDAAREGLPQKLVYVGKAGTGFTDAMLNKLQALLTSLRTDICPFESRKGIERAAIFTQPRLVGEFEFTEFTRDNILRHPSFKGLRADKNPRDVVREFPPAPTEGV